MLNRRNILLGLIAAPAVVRASSLMPVKSWLWTPEPPIMSFSDIVAMTLRNRAAALAKHVQENNALLNHLRRNMNTLQWMDYEAQHLRLENAPTVLI